MELLDFLNEHENWEDMLTAAPYSLRITKENNYVIFMYQPFISDMSLELVQEARGPIFWYNQEDEEWECVCYPFDKFFNSIEPQAATHYIDWASAAVQQKVDGSLIKFWYHNNEWHISTNGSIDAYTTKYGAVGSFGDLVERAVGGDIKGFTAYLNPSYCYMFELTSPENKIVVKYEGTHLWYLGRRNMETLEEEQLDHEIPLVYFPKLYNLHSLSDCYAAAREMDLTEEGYVVVDNNYNRIKIKGAAYLAAHKVRGNGIITVGRVIQMWQDDILDDFLGICPEYQDYATEVTEAIKNLAAALDTEYYKIVQYPDATLRKQFANYVTHSPQPFKSYFFSRYDGKTKNSFNFLHDKIHWRAIATFIISKLSAKEVGVLEDE